MPRRVVQRRRVKIPIGDLRDPVIVHETTSRPKRGGSTEKVFTPIVTLWMKIETLGPSTHDFNDVNIGQGPTHQFSCRWSAKISAENFLGFRGRYFEILSIEDIDERCEYLIMRCRETGSITKGAAKA